MRVHVHATCWNEERMLPFFLRHYEPVADRIFVYDDDSTDRSREILARSPLVTTVPVKLEGDSYVDALRHLYDHCWKQSRGEADWVVICNIDEHFFHPAGLERYLAACRRVGVTLVHSIGFEMLADRFPDTGDDLAAAVQRGVRATSLDKPAVFSPDAITEINFAVGRHHATPTGRVVMPTVRELRLLHYKRLGLEYVKERYTQLQARRRSRDVRMQWGCHYANDAAAIAGAHTEMARQSRRIVPSRIRLATVRAGWRLCAMARVPLVRATIGWHAPTDGARA